MIYKRIIFFLCFSSLFANAESYSLIEKTDNMLKTGQDLSVEEIYEAAKSAYAIEEYSYAISFLRYINDELDLDDYDDERNNWIRMIKEVEVLTGRYKNDSAEKDNVIMELEELRYNFKYFKNCDFVQENIEEILAGTDFIEYENCAYIEYNIGKILFKEEEYSEALLYYKLSTSLSPYNRSYQSSLNSVLSYYIKEAGDYADFKDYGTAIENYLTALEYMSEDNANYEPLLYKISQAYYYDKQEEEALIYLSKLVDNESEYFDPEDYNALYLMGECYRKLESYENAITSYDNALYAVGDESAQAFYKLGRVHAAMYKYALAIEYYQEAVFLKSDYYQAYESLGIAYQSIENTRKAIENYKLSLEYKPRNYQCWARLARLYNDTQKYEKAKQCAEECLLYKRNYAGAYFEIGRAEKALGNPFVAIANFEKAQKNSKYRKSSEAEIKAIQAELSN